MNIYCYFKIMVKSDKTRQKILLTPPTESWCFEFYFIFEYFIFLIFPKKTKLIVQIQCWKLKRLFTVLKDFFKDV